MMLTDFFAVIQWWGMFLLLGFLFLPLTAKLFSSFFDRGYIFAKILSIAAVSYVVLVIGTVHLLSFKGPSFFIVVFTVCFFVFFSAFPFSKKNYKMPPLSVLASFFLEEAFFFIILLFWSLVRSFQPDIHGLEKFMDFGFVNAILKSSSLPPKDMWFSGHSINYYYFGHLSAAVLTKLSLLPSRITFNLMIATLSSLCFGASFSVGTELFLTIKKTSFSWLSATAGIVSAVLVTFSGNLQTVYTLFSPYQSSDNPLPFWQLPFHPANFPNNYWYPNATRFIYHTIHEFPSYSFIVSDLHGHVSDIPFVILTIAVLLSLFLRINNSIQNKFSFFFFKSVLSSLLNNFQFLILLGFLLSIMYMTNAWDGIIYFLLLIFVLCATLLKQKTFMPYILHITCCILFIGVFFLLFSLPFSLTFKPFVFGIGFICAPTFLTNIGHIGPLLFEPAHCEHSPLWQLFTLYGFFYFWVIAFLVFLFSKGRSIRNLQTSDVFVLCLIIFSTFLIVLPEFVYVKDIYTTYFRANTMFKLTYQAFIMLSLSSGYILVRIFSGVSYKTLLLYKKFLVIFFGAVSLFLLFFVFIYPVFGINSYYNNVKTYHGLDGMLYIQTLYRTDYAAIEWINKNVPNQPVILEASGDSYTDFARVSANTGLPTVLGWPVHEWLWRGTYDIVSPRIADVKTLYETEDFATAKQLLSKYHVSYVFLGDLERQKYQLLFEKKFQMLGTLLYQNGATRVYMIK